MSEIEAKDLIQQEEDMLYQGIKNSLYTSGPESITDIQVQCLDPDDIHTYIKWICRNNDLPTDIKIPKVEITSIYSFDELNQLWDISGVEEGLYPLENPLNVYFINTGEACSMIIPIQLTKDITNVHIRNIGEDRTTFIQELYERASQRTPLDLCLVSPDNIKKR
jgi:hypothetical protein